jgi:hypothetical protein
MKFNHLNLKNLILIGILILGFGISGQPALGQAASDGATQLRDSVKQKVAEELSQIKQAISKKAFLGSVSAKNDATLTLATWTGQTRTVLVSTDAVIKLANGKDGTPADIKTDNILLVMGDADSQNTLTAKRLLVLPPLPTDKRQTVFGTVAKKTTSSLTLTTPKNESVTLKLTSATKLTAKSKLADIKVGDKIVTVSVNSTVLFLHLFPVTPTP